MSIWFVQNGLQHSIGIIGWASTKDLESDHPTIARDLSGVKPPIYSGGKSAVDAVKKEFDSTLQKVIVEIRRRHYSIRTEKAYLDLIVRYIKFHNSQNPEEIHENEVKTFLEYLAVGRNVSASTQNQALNALVFLYNQVLQKPLENLGEFTRAKRPRKLPVVLSVQEVKRLLEAINDNTFALMAGLLYGGGLRLMECIRLRVHDIDFDYQQIFVRNGKGQKDRGVSLPKRYRIALQAHLDECQKLHAEDLERGFGAVYLPEALVKKYPNAAKEWGWQYTFPSKRLSIDPRSRKTRRQHRDR